MAVFTVNSILDLPDSNVGDGICEASPGVCTLRAAIQEANFTPDADEIRFSIGTGTQTITINYVDGVNPVPLPQITSPLTINGTTQPGYVNAPRIIVNGNGRTGLDVISGNTTIRALDLVNFLTYAVQFSGPGGNSLIESNIGVDESGATTVGNAGDGIIIDGSPLNTIGGTATNARNIIGGNTGNGILIRGANAINNLIQNNFIGTNTSAAVDLGNGTNGIRIQGGASDNTIGGTSTGMPNTIAFNDANGVSIDTGDGNALRRNQIFSNSLLAIDLTNGANQNIPTPTITSVGTRGGSTAIQGRLTGAKPTTNYIIEFFSSPTLGPSNAPQARTFYNSRTVTTDSKGAATIDFSSTTTLATGIYVAATATEDTSDRNTSELSAASINVTTTDLVLTGTATPNPVAQNGMLTYTFLVTNSGDLTADATFTDTLPSGVTFVQATSTQGTVNRTGNNITVNLGLIQPDGKATITIQVVPTALNNALSNTGTVTAPEDPNPANNSVTLTSQVVLGIDLNVQGSVLPNPGFVGQDLVFQYVVTNQGATGATLVTVTGNFPRTVRSDFVGISTTRGTASADSKAGTFSAQIGNLGINESAIVRIIVKPREVGNYNSRGTASGNQPEIFTGNNTSNLRVAVKTPPPTPDPTTPPKVNLLNRYGVHLDPSTIVVGYTTPMNETSVKALSNYTLVTAGRDGHFNTADDMKIPFAAATYNATTRQVSLRTRNRFPVHQEVQLTINGNGATAVRSLNNINLDGNFDGKAGSNFVWRFSAFGPGPITGPQVVTAALARARQR